jgi:predicted ATP-grasp superfamily ATP-dependent carboligase
VGTITTEYLIDHLQAEKIGYIWFKEMSPVLAVHNKNAVDPFGVYYSKKYNLVIMHALTNVRGVEWEVAEVLKDVCKQLQAKELISIEGVGAMDGGTTSRVFYYADKKSTQWEKRGITPLEEGVVLGVTASLIMKIDTVPLSCLFAETHSNLPDSRAAAAIVSALDKYLGLKIDTKPLLKKAEQFESKIKKVMESSNEAVEDMKSKSTKLNYFG